MAADPSKEDQTVWQIPAALRLELLALLSTAPNQPARMTYEEFLDWADEDTRAEWVAGRVEMPSPVSVRHQRIAQFLFRLLTEFAGYRQLGEVFTPPLQMRLEHSGREPDVLFVAREHLTRLKPTYLDGPADLVVEVLSPESVGRDRGEKYHEYLEARIPEYWLVDPLIEQVELYQLSAEGKYVTAQPEAGGILRSRVLPGFWVRTDWLWADPLPNVEDALLEVDGATYAQYLLDRLRRSGALPGQVPAPGDEGPHGEG